MSDFTRSSILAVALLALCPTGRAHAQAAPVPYANSNWFLGLGNSGIDGGDGASRNGMPTGWFMTSTQSSFNTSSFSRLGAFGNYSGLSSEGVQFGYALKNTPLSIYAGFDSLKYKTPDSAASHGAFAAFNSGDGATPGGYAVNSGVEFRPSSNVTLSLGASFSQQSSGLVDSDIKSQALPGQTLAIGGRPLR